MIENIETNHIDYDDADPEEEDFEKDNFTVLTNNPCDWGHVAEGGGRFWKDKNMEESLRGARSSFLLVTTEAAKKRGKLGLIPQTKTQTKT